MTRPASLDHRPGAHSASSPPTRTFPDLRADVWLDRVPEWVGTELPALYGNPFSTMEYFCSWDKVPLDAMSVCTLDEPRHVIVFTRDGGTVTVLNKLLCIEPDDVDRLVRALHRSLDRFERVRVEITSPPERLRTPHWTTHDDEDWVIAQPLTVDEYRSRVKRDTRKTVRKAGRRLDDDHPGWEWRVRPGATLTDDDLRETIRWKAQRMEVVGKETGLRDDPSTIAALHALLGRYGVVGEITIDGKVASRELSLRFGDQAWIEWDAFDRAYEPYGLGTLSLFRAVEAFVTEGATVHLLWGTGDHKRRLGAERRRQFRVTAYPSRARRWLDLPECVAAVRASRSGRRAASAWASARWHARRAVGRFMPGRARGADGR